MAEKLIALKDNRWYAWQMFPGYCHTPYFSPVFLTRVQSNPNDPELLQIELFDVFDSEGALKSSLYFKILKRAAEFLVGEIIIPNNPQLDRIGILSIISFGWLYLFVPDQMEKHPPRVVNQVEEDIQEYLEREFGTQRGRE